MRTLAILTLAVCSAFAATPKSAAPQSDAVIEANIRAKFGKSKIDAEHFRVTVKGGIATIEGKTDVPQRKGVATRLAKTGGAREVVNKIQVSDAARQKLADRLAKAREKRAAEPHSKSAETPVKTAASAAPQQPEALRRMQVKR